ncbi:MAG: cytochrome c biogenesis protein ResB [Spirochaetales bacterium]|nr:cytochrome c biogenesis protein ResB [Spirochaetales bacterium]
MAVLTALILFSIPATMIPQNQSPSFYLQRYPETPGHLILALELDHFYSSIIFLTLITLFWINLLLCTAGRFSRQIKLRKKGRYGPDILHLGLLLLIGASLFSFLNRQEGSIFLKAGDTMILPSGRYLNMEEFIFEQYPDGRPKSWISKVNISDSPETEGETFEIAVNRPLRIDGLVFYQASYRSASRVGEYESGLMLTSDPARIYILMSFFIIFCGLMLTLFQPRRRKGVNN